MKNIFVYIFLIIITVGVNIYALVYWEPNKNIDIGNNQIQEYNNSEDKVVLNTKSLYLVDKDYISDYLTSEEILDIKNIIGSLSIVDIERIKELYNSEDDESLIDIFKLLNKRLSEDDYKKLEQICSKIIDISSIESSLKNNYV